MVQPGGVDAGHGQSSLSEPRNPLSPLSWLMSALRAVVVLAAVGTVCFGALHGMRDFLAQVSPAAVEGDAAAEVIWGCVEADLHDAVPAGSRVYVRSSEGPLAFQRLVELSTPWLRVLAAPEPGALGLSLKGSDAGPWGCGSLVVTRDGAAA